MTQPTEHHRPARALGLCSGGLDSMLAGLVLRRQGIDVEWISFETPFFSADKARKASRQTGIRLHVRDLTPAYLEMIKDPPGGFGKNMNPCMDCHSLMFAHAGAFMREKGFDFLFSGEVLGQRPMSQTAPSLRYVEKHSGFGGAILRPLSAQRLPETPMEQQGLVDRSRLLGFSGRSRKPQMRLAAEFGITDYPSPAGGCLLTDPGYSRRLKDLFDHDPAYTVAGLHLLKYGRHMRLSDETKIIVGRTQQENEQIVQHYDAGRDALIKVGRFPGPTVVMPGSGPQQMLLLAAAICVGYSKAPNDNPTAVSVATPEGRQSVTVLGIGPADAKKFLIGA